MADASSVAAESLQRRVPLAAAIGWAALRYSTSWAGADKLKHNPQPAVGEKTGNLPRWYSDEPDACQGSTDQCIEVVGAKPRRNAHDSSCCAVLEAPFSHAWYVTEAQTVMRDEIVRRRRLPAPA